MRELKENGGGRCGQTSWKVGGGGGGNGNDVCGR